MTGNAHVDNASGTEFDDYKDEQGSKEAIGDLTEITCPAGIRMMLPNAM